MTRRIYLTTFLVGLTVMLLCGTLFFGLQVAQTLDETYEAMHDEALYARTGLAQEGVAYLAALEPVNRVTWLSPAGEVLYDSHPIPGELLRLEPEVLQALERGAGRAFRVRAGDSRVCVALRCADGSVLRLSRAVAPLQYALGAVIPTLWVLVLVLLLSGVAAYRVSRMVLRPINDLDLEEADPDKTYPELAPLVRRVREQKQTIAQEAEAREQLRKEFTANVSHELRTPLTSISGFAELLRDGLVPPEEAAEFGADIYRESRRMLALVDDLLRLSKLDEARGLPEAEPVELLSLAKETAESLAPAAKGREIQLTVTGQEITVRGIRQLIQEMYYNLIDNAIKYNRDGGSVTVTVGRERGHGKFTVTDTGIGIPQEAQERVFERFYRVDKSHSKKLGGTGLGLSIVKHAALAQGAEIRLDSEEGHGTAISVIFPIH